MNGKIFLGGYAPERIRYLAKRPEFLFFTGFGLFICSVVLSVTSWGYGPDGYMPAFTYSMKAMRYLAYLICIIKILKCDRYTRKGFATLIIITSVVFLSFLGSSNQTMLLYFILFVAACHIRSRSVIKCCISIQTVVLVVTVGASQLGILNNFFVIEDSRVRYFLGFDWTTNAPALYLFILLEYIYLREGKLKLREALLFLAGAGWFFAMTKTKMLFLTTAAFLLFFSVKEYVHIKGWLKKPADIFFMAAPWLAAAFTLALHACYRESDKAWIKLNAVLNHRLELGHAAIQKYGFSLFGREIKWIGNGLSKVSGEYNYVDSGYLQIALEYGLLFLALVLAAYTVIMKCAINRERYYVCQILLFVLILSVTEPRLLNLSFHPFTLLCVTDLEDLQAGNHKFIKFRGLKLYGRGKHKHKEELYL